MELTTSRLHLREFVQEDWPAVFAYQSDPRYLRFYEWEARTPEEAREFVRMFLDQQREIPRMKFQLAIVRQSDHRMIGNCGIRMRKPGAHEGDIGYELAPDCWGQGYATEATRAIVEFGFTQLGLHRISSSCVADNVASARVLEKLGMKLEGRLRENEYYKGRWWDTLLYAILDHEWMSAKP
jgi:RimJ/RimL family protein N-acetyltransferase